MRLTRVHNIREAPFNAKGDGVTDDTTAFQTLLDLLSYDNSTDTGGYTTVVYVPNGKYRITTTLTYEGSSGHGIHFRGDTSLARGSYQGSCLWWDGANGGTLMDCQAINGSTFEDIYWDGGTKAKYLLRLRSWHNPGLYSDFAGSSGVNFYRCKWDNPADDTTSALVAAGNAPSGDGNTYQSDTYRFFNCFFQGHNETGDMGWGFKALNGGNVKLFVFANCTFGNLHRGIEADSGSLLVMECNAANIGYDRADGALIVHSGNTCTVVNGGMENSNEGYMARLVDNGFSCKTTLQGVYFAGSCPPDDIVVQAAGPLTVLNCDFERNGRTASNVLDWAAATTYVAGQLRGNGTRIYECLTGGTSAGAGGPTGTATSGITDNTVEWGYVGLVEGDWPWIMGNGYVTDTSGSAVQSYASLQVIGCSFKYQTTNLGYPPVKDGSGNLMLTGDYVKGAETGIVWIGNTYSDEIGPAYLFRDYFGNPPKVLSQCVLTDSNTTGVSVLRDQPGLLVVRIPYTAVQTAALTKTLQFGQFPAKWRVKAVTLDYTAAFAHPTGTITAKVGTATNDDDYIVDSSTAAGRIGLAGGDLGAGLATPVNGGYVPSWTATTDMEITFTSTLGNLSGLTAGSVDIYFEFEPKR